MINKYWKYILCFLVGILLVIFFIPEQKVQYRKEIKTDTIYVDRIKVVEIEKENITKPNKIKISKSSDKELRESIENKPIITTVTATNNLLTVQSIDTAGIVSETEYQIEPDDKVTVDNSGVEVESDKKQIRKDKRKKVFRKVGTVVVIIVAVIIGSQL